VSRAEGGAGDEDGVEWRIRGQALAAVPGKDRGVGVAEGRQQAASVVRQHLVAFDGKHIRGEFGEEGGHVSGAGTDFEDAVGGQERERFQHEDDDIGLGNGLAFADGEGMIVIGFAAVCLGNKFITRHAQHGAEDALVGDAAGAKLVVDHAGAGGGDRHHELGAGFWVSGPGLLRGYFLRRRMRTSKLTTPFWSRVPTADKLRLK